MMKRRMVGLLAAGGLSVAALLGASGTAAAAGSFSVTGEGATPQAAQDAAAAKASTACNGRYFTEGTGSLVGNPGGTLWTATIWIGCY
ncbi:hypothetical protein [Streptomyces caniscabiei]|nr:hypothetical protein [Streptomyces caniscabiei]